MSDISLDLPFDFGGEDTLAATKATAFLRREVPSSMRGPAWDLLLGVVGTSEQRNWDLAEQVEDQLFESTAQGKYLQRLAARSGIRAPAGVGMQDEDFRRLLIALNSSQGTPESICDVLEVYFGRRATHASIQSAAEPFNLPDGATLTLTIDGKDSLDIVFGLADFADATAATALEVAAVLNRAFQKQGVGALALAETDASTAETRVFCYTDQPGLSGSYQVTAGTAQHALQFPTQVPLSQTSAGDQWTVTRQGQRLRFAYVGVPRGLPFLLADLLGGGPSLGPAAVHVGDYVVALDEAMSAANQGSYRVVNVYWSARQNIRWFEVENTAGSPESFTQQTSGSICFFRPTLQTLYDQPRRAYVRQGKDLIEVVVPATAEVVTRQPGQAAYLVAQQAIDVVSSSVDWDAGIVTLITATPHGIVGGGQVLVDGLAVLAGTCSGQSLNGSFAVTAIESPTSFSYRLGDCGFRSALPSGSLTDQLPYSLGGEESAHTGSLDVSESTVTAVAAPAHEGPNAIIYDPAAGLHLAGTASTTTKAIEAQHGLSLLDVADATQFPDQPGYVVVGLGYEYQAAPVPYLGRASQQQLLLDPSFAFPAAVPTGTTVNLLSQRGSGEPESPETDGGFYLTGSQVGRVAAQQNIEKLAAAGVEVVMTVEYPGDVGLGGESQPHRGQERLTDAVAIYAGDDVDAEVEAARQGPPETAATASAALAPFTPPATLPDTADLQFPLPLL